jgi:putative transposase
VYHALNRANARAEIFAKPGDYQAFEKVLSEAVAQAKMRLLAYCLMPNHWHLVVWPREDGDLSTFMQWLTVTHVRRWHAHRQSFGTGHLYQGRFKSFPVQTDWHVLRVCRYVERNALRAELAWRAEDWRWGSLWRRERGDAEAAALLTAWPVDPPRDWIETVNEPQTAAELDAIRICIARGRPFGSESWQKKTAERLGLSSALRAIGRPRHQRGGGRPGRRKST